MSDRLEILRGVPLLESLDPDELALIAPLFVEESYRRGDTVCRQGEEGDSFYVVASGELEVWSGAGGDRFVGNIGPGEPFGEMSLLLGGARTATVTVSKPARLLALSRDAFDRHLRGNLKILEHLSRLLARRLVQVNVGEPSKRGTMVVAVVGEPGLVGKTLIARTLGGLLQDIGASDSLLIAGDSEGSRGRPLLSELADASTERVSSRVEKGNGGPALLSIEVDARDRPADHALGALLSKLGERFPHVVLDLGSSHRRVAREAADVVVELVERPRRTESEPEPSRARHFEVLNLHSSRGAGIPISHCEPFSVPSDPALARLEPELETRYLRENPSSPAAIPLHRLARKILGVTVGVALGGGASFSIAHVGILRVFEEAGVPVDLVAGTSGGGLFSIGGRNCRNRRLGRYDAYATDPARCVVLRFPDRIVVMTPDDPDAFVEAIEAVRVSA